MTSNSEEGDPLLETNQKPFWKSCVYETFMFIHLFAIFLPTTCTSNLLMERACTLNFNHTKDECRNITNNTTLLNDVQSVANNYTMYSTILRVLPAVVLNVFIGPWSDKYGRKGPVYISITGTMVSSFGMIWFAYIDDLPLYISVLTTIPLGFSGGMISVLGCIYAMVSENTSSVSRTTRYATLELSVLLAVPISGLLSGLLYDYFGYLPVFSLALCMQGLSLIYFGFINEKRITAEATIRRKFMDFFSLERLKDSVQTALRERENKGRKQILLLGLSMAIIILNYIAVSDIMFLFCEKMYNWSVAYYSIVSAISMIGVIIALAGAVPVLTRYWKVSDPCLGLLGLVSMIAQNLLRSFATQPWLYFVSVAAGLLSFVAPLAVRSRMSKLVWRTELGKVFSVVAIVESLVPVPGTILYTQVYNATVDFFPGLAFIVGATTLLFPIAVLLWITRLPEIEHLPKESETDMCDEREVCVHENIGESM